MNMLVAAWRKVSESSVTNYFTKTEISEALMARALQDEDDPFQDLVAEMETLWLMSTISLQLLWQQRKTLLLSS